tara:strand:- start:1244 stop:1486 length:243 start_codon:yes stop_codon:yes gene_type:complete
MNTVTKFHLDEAQKHLRKALGYSSEDENTEELQKMTDILSTLDGWKGDKPVKHVLNNSGLRWDNEYAFFPSLQEEDSDVQ